MTFIDYVRRTIDPHRAQERSSPSRPPNRAAQRANARNPRLPADNESFADFTNRGGEVPYRNPAITPDAERRIVERQAEQARMRARYRDTVSRGASLRGREIVGRAMVDANNMPSARLLDIPIGRGAPEGIDPGRSPAQGYTYNPATRALGLIQWGVDMRRALTDIIRDVETATGAPDGYLRRLSGKESGNNANATPGTSSASGYFQITNDTWSTWANGNGYHPDLGQRFRQTYNLDALPNDEMQEYRLDPRVDGAMAAEIARHSYESLRSRGVQNVTEGHLYLGHFGGPNGLELAYDQSQGNFRNRFGFQYFAPGEVDANEPVFFEPKLDSNGRPERRAVTRNGRTVYVQVGDRTRPRTTQQVWDRLTGPFNTTDAVQFRPRVDGSDAALLQ